MSCPASGSEGKESAYNVGDLGSISGLGKSSGGGHGNPLQYSCLENPRGQRSLWATVHAVAKSWDTTEQLSTAQHKLLQGLEFISGMSSPVY